MYAVCFTPTDDAEVHVYATARTFKAAQRKFKLMCGHRGYHPGTVPLKPDAFTRCFIIGPDGRSTTTATAICSAIASSADTASTRMQHTSCLPSRKTDP